MGKCDCMRTVDGKSCSEMKSVNLIYQMNTFKKIRRSIKALQEECPCPMCQNPSYRQAPAMMWFLLCDPVPQAGYFSTAGVSAEAIADLEGAYLEDLKRKDKEKAATASIKEETGVSNNRAFK
jgi:hypothetical protein